MVMAGTGGTFPLVFTITLLFKHIIPSRWVVATKECFKRIIHRNATELIKGGDDEDPLLQDISDNEKFQDVINEA